MSLYVLQVTERAPSGPNPIVGTVTINPTSPPGTADITVAPAGDFMENDLLSLTTAFGDIDTAIQALLDGAPNTLQERITTTDSAGVRTQTYEPVSATIGTQAWVDTLNRRIHPQYQVRFSSLIEDDAVIIRMDAAGALTVGTNKDFLVVPIAGSITAVYLYRETAGSSSSTILDVHKNGTTLWTTGGNRPQIAFDDSDKKVAATLPDVVAVAAGDILTLDVDQVEAGSPADAVLTLSIDPT